jgi:hypothetical protein
MSDYRDPMAKHNATMTLAQLDAAHEASKTASNAKKWQAPTRKTPARSTPVTDVAVAVNKRSSTNPKLTNHIPSDYQLGNVGVNHTGKTPAGPTKALPNMKATKKATSPSKTR